jgi:hypothetical protein
MGKTVVCFMVSFLVFSSKALTQLGFRQKPDSIIRLGKILVLPQNFYNQHLGFICKKEDQLQKRTGLNLFIRLGDKRQVDYLEGKSFKHSSFVAEAYLEHR